MYLVHQIKIHAIHAKYFEFLDDFGKKPIKVRVALSLLCTQNEATNDSDSRTTAVKGRAVCSA